MIDYECEKKDEGKMMLRQYTNIYNKYCILKKNVKIVKEKLKEIYYIVLNGINLYFIHIEKII